MFRTIGKKMGVVLIALILVFILLYIGINLYSVLSTKDKMFSLDEKEKMDFSADGILVLGAGVRNDGTPSHMLQDRLLTALELYESGKCKTIIVSGDHGSTDYDEVNVMKNFLIERGVSSERIFMDHAGFSTYDSIFRAKEIFGAKKLIVITQKYHAYRSLMIGHHLGLDCVAVSAPILSSDMERYSKQGWYSFRESIARCKDFLYCVLKPSPMYLGESISLKGSGDVTNDKESQ